MRKSCGREKVECSSTVFELKNENYNVVSKRQGTAQKEWKNMRILQQMIREGTAFKMWGGRNTKKSCGREMVECSPTVFKT